MNKAEFQQACEIARSDKNLDTVDDTILDGFGLPDFKPVTCSIDAVAKMIRWQAIQLNGQWDNEALTECANAFRRKVTIINP